MKTILVCMFGLTSSLQAEVPQSILNDLSTIREERVCKTTQNFPPQIRRALARTFRQKKLEMADAGMPFQQTDFAIRRAGAPVLPTRRLIFAFETSRYFVVYYESIAVGLGANALIFRVNPSGHVTLVWGGVETDYANLAKSPHNLVRRLRLHKLIDDQPFMW